MLVFQVQVKKVYLGLRYLDSDTVLDFWKQVVPDECTVILKTVV
jgi:hypothetical protein